MNSLVLVPRVQSPTIVARLYSRFVWFNSLSVELVAALALGALYLVFWEFPAVLHSLVDAKWSPA